MIYVLEGADGTGKSTLATLLAAELEANVIHATYNKAWNMQRYHTDLIQAANRLSQYQPVILDRWAPSEAVYGEVFRGGESFDTMKLINTYKDGITWIYCRNDDVVENHRKNQKLRKEMFGDMTQVAQCYESYVSSTPELGWITYDFNKVQLSKFKKELPR